MRSTVSIPAAVTRYTPHFVVTRTMLDDYLLYVCDPPRRASAPPGA